jgi:hypothetical protein
MLAGADPYDIDTLGRRLHTAWLGFIRTGTPPPILPGRSTQQPPRQPPLERRDAVAGICVA